ncbi:hypothetical protein BKA70DRAFT_1278254 [Coprinopsis sp. MPI-PUGE-AT-0042]|nr:hypothetical protein BKA70DRAFT_1278254 [Coprinopsis sp. MPI-PUGE-AT-0042]
MPALTDCVTHLIALGPGSAKYSCALARKIPILSPDWILESYQDWLQGGDVDLEESVQRHRLPIFRDVVLCFSGITDSHRRAQIMKIVNENGGTFTKLERPVRVTHLLCSGDEQTDKMKMAERFNAKGEARIHLVWEEWFWDSLDFGGRFEEEHYLVKNPRPERRAVEEVPSQVPESDLSRAGSMSEPPPPRPPPPKPAALDLEDLEDEAASISIVPAVRLQVWGGLLERRGFEVSEGEVIRSPTKSQPKSQARTAKEPPLARMRGAGSAIASVRRMNSFAPEQPEAGPSTSQRALPFKRHPSSRSALSRAGTPLEPPVRKPSMGEEAQGLEEVPGPSSPKESSSSAPQIFAGVRICVLGEARTQAVRTAIEDGGGTWVAEEDDPFIDYYVVRLLSGSKIYQSEPDPNLRDRYRTECWLERCLHDERICFPTEHVSFTPLSIPIPVKGADKIQIGLSGLDQSESCHTRRLLRALGINQIPLFSRKATHLLCPSGTGQKFTKAIEWGIPVVGNGWLEDIAKSGSISPPDAYLVTGPPPTSKEAINVPVDRKGKGKATGVEEDVRMQDITNTMYQSPKHQPAALPGERLQSALESLPKQSNLERQATTLIPPDARPEGLGQPTELLGGSASSFSYSAPSRYIDSAKTLSQESPRIRFGTRTSSSVAHTVDESFFQGLPAAESTTIAQREKGKEKERDSEVGELMDDAEMGGIVPSSQSPSPMKPGPQPLGRRTSSMSPVKVDPLHAKALQESIVSLLGKRSSPDEDLDSPMAGPDDDVLPAVGGSSRGAKRKKNQRQEETQQRPKANATTRPTAARTKTSSSTDTASSGSVSRNNSAAEVNTRSRPRPRPLRPRRGSSPASSPPPGEGISLAAAAAAAGAFDPYGPGVPPTEQQVVQVETRRKKRQVIVTDDGSTESIRQFSSSNRVAVKQPSIREYPSADSGSRGAKHTRDTSVEEAEKNVRVVYEDPAQRQEREKLKKMLSKSGSGDFVSAESVEGTPSETVGRRRSTRLSVGS